MNKTAIITKKTLDKKDFKIKKISDICVHNQALDAVGRVMSTLVSAELRAGKHTRQWNAKGLPGGVYFYRLQAGRSSETRKLTLLK